MKQPKQNKPFIIEGEKKNYAWCACGESSNQPFCDGSHKSTDIKPIIFKNEKEGKIALCGCGKTESTPYCDGTHMKPLSSEIK